MRGWSWFRFEDVIGPWFEPQIAQHGNIVWSETTLAIVVTLVSMSAAVITWVYYVSKGSKESGRSTRAIAVFEFVKGEYGINRMLVNSMTWFSLTSSKMLDMFDRWIVDGIVNKSSDAMAMVSKKTSKLQSGYLQTYVFALIVGFVLTVLILVKGTFL